MEPTSDSAEGHERQGPRFAGHTSNSFWPGVAAGSLALICFLAAQPSLRGGESPDQSQPITTSLPGSTKSSGTAPKSVGAPPRYVDLTPYTNASLAGNWHGDRPDNDLSGLPLGEQNLAGTKFDVRGLIQLDSRESGEDAQFPPAVSRIRFGFRCQRLHFLHGAILGYDSSGTMIGLYVLHYADGRTREWPIVLGRDVMDWWKAPDAQALTNGLVVAWEGANGKSRPQGKTVRLYRTTVLNPRPEMEILSLDFVSMMARAGPFLVAVTADP
jgi:hypothetical protein